MRVLMMVQLVDAKEWLRGFTVGWIEALAARVAQVEVLTLEQGAHLALPPNVRVHSMGKEKGYSKARELLEFYRILGRVGRDTDLFFSHMTPRYTWLAAPLAALYHKPQMLWFTHRQDSRELRLALRAATWITTATPSSFPLASPKVHALGHGIDTVKFSPGSSPPDDPPLILAVGRITAIKHHHSLLEAAAQVIQAQPAARFAVIGQTAAPGDEAYLHNLQQQREALGLSEAQFRFVGALPPDELVNWYRRSAVVTNLTPAGSFDKAALEAMLTATPTLVTNPAFDALLGDHAPLLQAHSPNDVRTIAEKLTVLLQLDPQQRRQMGQGLRERCVAAHSLDQLMDRLVLLMQSPVPAG